MGPSMDGYEIVPSQPCSLRRFEGTLLTLCGFFSCFTKALLSSNTAGHVVYFGWSYWFLVATQLQGVLASEYFGTLKHNSLNLTPLKMNMSPGFRKRRNSLPTIIFHGLC